VPGTDLEFETMRLNLIPIGLTLIKPSARRRALVEAALTAYHEWASECASVRNAYHRWLAAGAMDEPFAFDAYKAALDREENAARHYARVLRRARHLTDTGLALELARIATGHTGC
jgi:hypothetical protein